MGDLSVLDVDPLPGQMDSTTLSAVFVRGARFAWRADCAALPKASRLHLPTVGAGPAKRG